MDPPKTRRELKKSPKDKKTHVYSAKHIRQVEVLLNKLPPHKINVK